jgi:hypothetical protein
MVPGVQVIEPVHVPESGEHKDGIEVVIDVRLEPETLIVVKQHLRVDGGRLYAAGPKREEPHSRECVAR